MGRSTASLFRVSGLLAGFYLAACAEATGPHPSAVEQQNSPTETGEPETVMVFFFLVNESGRDVRVRVLADGEELFVRAIEAKGAESPAAEEAPPPGESPARELKVPLERNAESLTVEELNSGASERFDIRGFHRLDAGFRITIREDAILVKQDYLPVR